MPIHDSEIARLARELCAQIDQRDTGPLSTAELGLRAAQFTTDLANRANELQAEVDELRLRVADLERQLEGRRGELTRPK